jgi:hypothetical protein
MNSDTQCKHGKKQPNLKRPQVRQGGNDVVDVRFKVVLPQVSVTNLIVRTTIVKDALKNRRCEQGSNSQVPKPDASLTQPHRATNVLEQQSGGNSVVLITWKLHKALKRYTRVSPNRAAATRTFKNAVAVK